MKQHSIKIPSICCTTTKAKKSPIPVMFDCKLNFFTVQ